MILFPSARMSGKHRRSPECSQPGYASMELSDEVVGRSSRQGISTAQALDVHPIGLLFSF